MINNIDDPELIAVHLDLKPATAKFMLVSEYQKYKELLKKLNLSFEVSDFKLLLPENSGPPIRVSSKYPKGHVKVYISKDINTVRKLKLYDFRDHIKKVGELLGYPICCIELFSRKTETSPVIDSYLNSRKFDWHLNNLLYLSLIKYFPCSYYCKESMKYSKNLYKLIFKSNPNFAKNIYNQLKDPLLYFYPKNRKCEGADGSYVRFDGRSGDKLIKYRRVLEYTIKDKPLIINIIRGEHIQETPKGLHILNKDKEELYFYKKSDPFYGIILPFDQMIT